MLNLVLPQKPGLKTRHRLPRPQIVKPTHQHLVAVPFLTRLSQGMHSALFLESVAAVPANVFSAPDYPGNWRVYRCYHKVRFAGLPVRDRTDRRRQLQPVAALERGLEFVGSRGY